MVYPRRVQRFTSVALVALLSATACEGGHALTRVPPDPDAGAAAPPICGGFTIPNPTGAGLPNVQVYKGHADGTITDEVAALVWDGTVRDHGLPQQEAAALRVQ
jgi:hypothetical protein